MKEMNKKCKEYRETKDYSDQQCEGVMREC